MLVTALSSVCRKAFAQAVEDLDSAIAYGRKLPEVRQGPVLLAGQSRGGFLAMHYAGLRPSEVLGVVNFSGGWYPYGLVTTPYYARAGRGGRRQRSPALIYMPTTIASMMSRFSSDIRSAGSTTPVPNASDDQNLRPSRFIPVHTKRSIGVQE